MSIGKIRNLGVGGATVKPLYLVKDGKAQVGVIGVEGIVGNCTIVDTTSGFARISVPNGGAGTGRFSLVLDGKKYSTVHIKYSTTDYRANLNSIGVCTDLSAIPFNFSYQTISTETWSLTPNVDNYIAFRLYNADAVAVIDVYELYIE